MKPNFKLKVAANTEFLHGFVILILKSFVKLLSLQEELKIKRI